MIRRIAVPPGWGGALLRDREPEDEQDGQDHHSEEDELDAALIQQRRLVRLCDHVHDVPFDHAGPYHAGAVPPVRNSLRLRSAASSNGRWIANSTMEAPRNMKE